MQTIGLFHEAAYQKQKEGFHRERDLKTNIHFFYTQEQPPLYDMIIITILRNLSRMSISIFVLSVLLFNCNTGNRAFAYDTPSNSASSEEDQGTTFINIDEEKAYRAAKKEPDSRKRAMKLFEFYLKYPKSALMQETDYEEIKIIENAYNDYYAARNEPDLEKRAALLIEFSQKYPDSDLIGYISDSYMRILKELRQEKKYELLESLSEKWLIIHPKNREAYAFIAEAAMNLHQFEKCGESFEAIYEIVPSPILVKEIYNCYQKTENLAKRIEWADKLFEIPEFDDDYMLRYECMTKFYEEKNLLEAAKYAKLTLESVELVEQRDANKHGQLQKVRWICYHIIASNFLEKDDYAEAVTFFKKAVQAEPYGQGYYKIGLCLDNQKEIEEAMLYYAMAELMNGEDASKAKSRLEILYRALHNQTLIGIEKVYKKAKESLAEPTEQKFSDS